ncbi:hypothetical protein [Jiella sp. M17.18]|uniref:HVO_A0114 family putative DNA-binding protein n=1 Tax=Jiella sp. M17.18 TaxID=3234247 RepID=UPI0034DE3E10
MNEIILSVATHEAFFDDLRAAARRIDAGDFTPNTPRLSFETIDDLWRTMTPERWALLGALQHRGATKPEALSDLLGRDRDAVAADVEKLTYLGLIEADEAGRVFVPWSKITAEVSIANAA